MKVLKVQFDGRVFVPQAPVHLPVGTVLEISLGSPTGGEKLPATLAQLADIARLFPDNPDTPTDLAEQHDHYLYGTPKRP